MWQRNENLRIYNNNYRRSDQGPVVQKRQKVKTFEKHSSQFDAVNDQQ